jgi:hypothetical protein
MALRLLAYNLKRVMKIIGIAQLCAPSAPIGQIELIA